jgi:hypothetical protein
MHALLWQAEDTPGSFRPGKRVCQSASRLLQGIMVRGDRWRLSSLTADGVTLAVTPSA